MKAARFGQALACVAWVACAKPEARKTADPASSPSTTALVAPPSAETDALGSAERDRGTDVEVDLTPFTTLPPVWAKSIGHTSVVFKVRLQGGREAAWKPRSKRGATRYRGEIAAYRLGRALGLSNVPPALPRSFTVAELRSALGDPSSGAGKLFADEAIPDPRGEVRGAMIPWIPDLRFIDLEAEPKRSEWRAWLGRASSIPPDKSKLAEQVSTMIVFDYLTANWDRWSGGNVGTDASGRVLYIDNDGAFFDPPPSGPLARQRALLAETARFSRRFIAAVRALDPETARAAMGEDAPGEPLLAPRVLAGLEERRRTALSVVDARVAEDGEDRILCFE